MGRPVPLLALAGLCAVLSARELLTPVPTRAEASPTVDIDDAPGDRPRQDDPSAWGAESGDGASSKPLSEWLNEELSSGDAEAVEFAVAGDGFETVGDMIEEGLTEDDFRELGLNERQWTTLMRKLDDVGSSRKPDAETFGKPKPKAAPVSPMKTAIASGCRYLFFAGMILMYFGEKMFAMAGLAKPAWFDSMVANKTRVMIGLMAISNGIPMILGVPR